MGLSPSHPHCLTPPGVCTWLSLASPEQSHPLPLERSSSQSAPHPRSMEPEEPSAPSPGVHLCPEPSHTPHEGRGTIWKPREGQFCRVGCGMLSNGPLWASLSDPLAHPAPDLFLRWNGHHARPQEVRQIPHFMGEGMEIQPGAFTCSRSPAGRDGLGSYPLHTQPPPSLCPSWAPGEHTQVD